METRERLRLSTQRIGNMQRRRTPAEARARLVLLTADRIAVVPVRAGVGVRLGANIGYLKFTPRATWNPF